MNAILRLPIKKKWFDMIASGEKREEYREATEYWRKRVLPANEMARREGRNLIIELVNGYRKNAPTIRREVEYVAVVIAGVVSFGGVLASPPERRPEWGWVDDDNTYFVFRLKGQGDGQS